MGQNAVEPKSDKKLVEEYLNWPLEFYVCQKHKESFFADYEQAILGNRDSCVLCQPSENDSLGG